MTAKAIETSIPNLKPIDNTVKTLQLNQTSDTSKADVMDVKTKPARRSRSPS